MAAFGRFTNADDLLAQVRARLAPFRNARWAGRLTVGFNVEVKRSSSREWTVLTFTIETNKYEYAEGPPIGDEVTKIRWLVEAGDDERTARLNKIEDYNVLNVNQAVERIEADVSISCTKSIRSRAH